MAARWQQADLSRRQTADFAAMMSGAMNQRPQKGSKQGSKQPDPNDLMKDLKVETVGQVLKLWDEQWLARSARSKDTVAA